MSAALEGDDNTPIPTTETNPPDASSVSTVTDEQWQGMQRVLQNVYAYRIEGDYDPSKVFHRKVNRRLVPDYYDVVKEPMALSTIKAKINQKEYKDFKQFVRDFALITYNAQVYNRPSAGAYQDALAIKAFVEKQLRQLVDEKVIDEDTATPPYLGEIPAVDEAAAAEEEEEDDEDEDDEDEDEDTDEEGGKKKKGRRGRPSLGGTKKDKDGDTVDARKRRGRPPRVDTPMEARIKNIMKGLRKPKNDQGQLMVSHFERLPDKAAMPEYFNEIKAPMAFDMLKKKLKRKKYMSVEQFMRDVEQMFENAKVYNEDESQIYKDAVYLQKEARKLAEEEKRKPDTDFAMEDGRIPVPDGIIHNGELWKVGDWVHIQNPNDLTKPIVAQIYRTYKDIQGQEWVNACWYYRPEQTVHRFDRHFYENEVVKTGQYRDHRIDEVVDRCFVMFFTRYNKGRPRNFPPDKEIYVCEARYNEEKFKLNKIKTWASCLPDEVRDRDYEMDLFDVPRKMKKVPSPIAYLLKDSQKETDDIPKPEWGAENAPPKIGAVHRRPRDPKDSPPPEPTPTPPPQPPPPPPRQPSMPMPTPVPNGMPMPDIARRPSIQPLTTPTPPVHGPQSFTASHPHHYPQHSISPAPPHQTPMPHHPQPPFSASAPLTHQASYTPQPPREVAPAPSYPPAPTPPARPPSYQQPVQPAPTPAARYQQPPTYQTPQPYEVYHLADNVNSLIPQDIRQQFQCDEQGHVLFFTAPPLVPAEGKEVVAHSVRYLAAKARREAMIREKRKSEGEAGAEEAESKRLKLEEETAFENRLGEVWQRGVQALEEQLVRGEVEQFMVDGVGDVKGAMRENWERVRRMQEEERERRVRAEEQERRRVERERISLVGGGGIWDARVVQ